MEDPNFPLDLNIHPLLDATSDTDIRFDCKAQEGAIRTYGIAGRIWEASHAMLAYFDPSSRLSCDFDPLPFTHAPPPTPILAVELGSGNGFVAARIAQWLRPYQDLLIATDLPEVCSLLESNLRSCSSVHVRPLPWGSREHADSLITELLHFSREGQWSSRLTHILCSDLVYFPSLFAPLLRSLLHLTSPSLRHAKPWCPPVVIISYKIRSLAKETPFWSTFGLWFCFSPVLSHWRSENNTGLSRETHDTDQWTRFSPGDASDGTFVLVASRRAESLSWSIPEDDVALLAGCGAYGSDLPRSDDQFERLLLMRLDV